MTKNCQNCNINYTLSTAVEEEKYCSWTCETQECKGCANHKASRGKVKCPTHG